jgi:hypothetical protein
MTQLLVVAPPHIMLGIIRFNSPPANLKLNSFSLGTTERNLPALHSSCCVFAAAAIRWLNQFMSLSWFQERLFFFKISVLPFCYKKRSCRYK